jgi:hypothetical protein
MAGLVIPKEQVMLNLSVVPALAGVAFIALITASHSGFTLRGQNRWMVPAAASFAYLLFTLHAVAMEGPFGFWPEHVRNLWGNQIWLDLLLCASIGWLFILPQAKALGLRPLPWGLLIVCTGSIGFLAFAARVLYVRDHSARAGEGASNTLPEANAL